MEEILLGILVNAGEARTNCIKAMKSATKKEFANAYELLAESREKLGKAHRVQTELIQKEAAGEKQEMNLLLVHAQDHLMTTIAVREIAEIFIQHVEQLEGELEELRIK